MVKIKENFSEHFDLWVLTAKLCLFGSVLAGTTGSLVTLTSCVTQGFGFGFTLWATVTAWCAWFSLAMIASSVTCFTGTILSILPDRKEYVELWGEKQSLRDKFLREAEQDIN